MTVHRLRRIGGTLVVSQALKVDTISERTSAAGVTIDGVKLKDSEPYCDVINEKTGAAGVTIDGAKLKDSLVEANLKDGVLIGGDAITKIKTGTYTGDGTTSKAITGIGFQPKMVTIWVHETSPAFSEIHTRMDQMYTNMSAMHFEFDSATDHPHGMSDDHLISLDADGFTVDDNAADSHPNKLNQVYDYIAFG